MCGLSPKNNCRCTVRWHSAILVGAFDKLLLGHPLRKLGLYDTARFSLKLPGFPFYLEVWALKFPVKMVPEIARRPTQSLVLQFAA